MFCPIVDFTTTESEQHYWCFSVVWLIILLEEDTVMRMAGGIKSSTINKDCLQHLKTSHSLLAFWSLLSFLFSIHWNGRSWLNGWKSLWRCRSSVGWWGLRRYFERQHLSDLQGKPRVGTSFYISAGWAQCPCSPPIYLASLSWPGGINRYFIWTHHIRDKTVMDHTLLCNAPTV